MHDPERGEPFLVPDPSMQPTLTVWPEVAQLPNLSRSTVYDAVARGEIPVIKIGRCLRVPTAALRRLLALDSREPEVNHG